MAIQPLGPYCYSLELLDMKQIRANIFNKDKISEAKISYDDKFQTIEIIGDAKKNLPFLIPGFIDLHVHGGGGADIMEGGKALHVVAQTHAKFGTTSFLATTMTAPFSDLKKSFLDMKSEFDQKGKNSARCLGVHLEGPFISDKKLGAQPNFAREATLKEIKELHNILPIKVITIAPEEFNHLNLISELINLGIMVQIGHTNGTYEAGVQALNHGAKSFTHLYNAMSGFHHRSPGMSGAALAHAHYAELIPDLEHVHPGAIQVALRCIPNLYFVTDATSATGMPDGDFKLGTQIVHKCMGGVRLKDGTLAGSALTMIQAYTNMKKFGLSDEQLQKKFSHIQADLLNISDRGSIKENFYADFVLLNDQDEIVSVTIEGEQCDH